jgi:predicted Zn-dependent protease
MKESATALLLRCSLVLLLTLPGVAAAQRVLEFAQQSGFSAAEVNAFASRAYGARLLALREARELDPDPALKHRLQEAMARLQRAAAYELPSASAIAWEVHACRGCDENASALPGGKLLLSADFLARLALTDDELAYLIAHEMAHVLAQHTREFASAARYFVDNGTARGYVDIERELGDNLAVLLRMKYLSRAQELEADRIGFVLGAHAGFAPDAMLALLEKLRRRQSSVLDMHPSAEQRLQQARNMLEAMRRLAARPVQSEQ